MIGAELRERTRFFAEHAGYSVPPGRYACALALAKAEAEGKRRGFTTEWVDDVDADLSWADIETSQKIASGAYPVAGCVAKDTETGDVESLWGIVLDGWHDPYMQVVEAEMFAQLLAESETREHWAARDVVTI